MADSVDLLSDACLLSSIVAVLSLDDGTVESSSCSTAQARLVRTEFDRDGDVGEQLRKWALNASVDASGSFESHGDVLDELDRSVHCTARAGPQYR